VYNCFLTTGETYFIVSCNAAVVASEPPSRSAWKDKSIKTHIQVSISKEVFIFREQGLNGDIQIK
jgi:hypothetical protein